MKTSTRFLAVLLALATVTFFSFAQGPTPKSQGEVDALMAIQNAASDDERIKASLELIEKFADTEFKSWALFNVMQTYEMKGDTPNMIVYAEQLLDANPSPFEAASAHVRIAHGVSRQTKEFDLDRDEKLQRVADHANKAFDLLATAPKVNEQIPDEQWQAITKNEEAIAYDALAQGEFVRKKYEDAAGYFVKAIQAQPDPVRMLKAGNAYRLAEKYTEAMNMLDNAINDPNSNDQVKALAEREKNIVKEALGAGL
jgi:tetratricopeptide (TPR) repeat protein